MKYVVVEWQGHGVLRHDASAYLGELPQLQEALPPGARAFACHPEHYDFSSQRCVKDLRMTSVPELPEGGASLAIRLAPNPWKHLGGLTIRYTGVTSLQVEGDGEAPFELSEANSLRLDEILPHQTGCTHELRFTTGTVRVTCCDLQAVWEPDDSATE